MSFNYEFIETSVRQFDDTGKLMDDGSGAQSTSARALVPPGADVLLKQKLMRFEILSETASPTTFIPSGVKLTGAPLLWKQSVTGQGVLVGVIDSGIDRNHPDLKGSVIIARDYVKDGLPMTKWNPHATHVAGTIAAHGRIFGVAPDAKLADYRVLDATEEGFGSNEDITAAIRQAVADGCHIINMSLGSEYDYRPMHDAIKEAVKKNVLVVVAVGNSGDGKPDTVEIDYPGYYHEVVGAASVEYNEQTGKITSSPFGNSNPEVDVCAVGSKVLSCIPGGKYAYFSGTSMASPHVSGFAALMLAKAKLRLGSGAFISEQVLFDMVKTMTVDMETTGIDSVTGAGLVTFYPSLPDKTTLDKLVTDAPRMTAALNKTCAAPEAIKSAVHSA